MHKTESVIEKLFAHQDARIRHLSAPMLSERQAYLGKLLAAGYKRELVKDRASTLCHIVERGCFVASEVTEEDISAALVEWLGNKSPAEAKELRYRGKHFIAVARHWTKHLGSYVSIPTTDCAFESELREFTEWLRHSVGFLDSSIASCVTEAKGFLVWLSPRCGDLSLVTLTEIDAYVSARTIEGRRRHTIIGNCQAIRTFFRYAEERGWSHNNLSRTVRTPWKAVTDCPPRCPPWKQIQQMLASLDTPNPSHVRARAILFLASVYGLRRSEIGKLTLEDFDWQNEVLTVRRAKRGRTQQFPLVFEVGEAVIRYLRLRPKCQFREVFLTLHTPIRPAKNFGAAVRKTFNTQKIFDRPWGLHAFRHACATELLRKGTSLRGIADFLGHRDIQSVSVYAHSDLRALRAVAAINLEGLICDS